MGFITSNNISVFPCGRRSDVYNAESRLTTEYNLVSIINRLVDKKSFIVTDNTFSSGKLTSANFSAKLSFNIGGYLFTASPKDIFIASKLIDSVQDSVDPSDCGTTGDVISARIGLNSSNTDISLIELVPLSPDSGVSAAGYTFLDYGEGATAQFTGVEFSKNKSYENTEEFDSLVLPLFEKRGSDWYLVEDSKIKFETNKEGTQRSVRIDDGELG